VLASFGAILAAAFMVQSEYGQPFPQGRPVLGLRDQSPVSNGKRWMQFSLFEASRQTCATLNQERKSFFVRNEIKGGRSGKDVKWRLRLPREDGRRVAGLLRRRSWDRKWLVADDEWFGTTADSVNEQDGPTPRRWGDGNGAPWAVYPPVVKPTETRAGSAGVEGGDCLFDDAANVRL
jgi:hypothetical protein